MTGPRRPAKAACLWIPINGYQMPTGGKREGACRPWEQRNKVTARIRDIAHGYDVDAVGALVETMRDAEAPPCGADGGE
jgi:hypothetical protein